MSALAIVVFSDLVDSTALLARLGDDRMEGIRRSHVDDVAGVVDAAGGRLIKTLGDGTMASFDSALGALRAAAGIQVAVERLDAAHDGIGFAARVGVAAGEPIAHKEDLHGMAVVIASRLCSAARSGEVLVQDLVYQLVASRDGVSVYDSGNYELKGVPDPVGASRLRWREVLDLSGRSIDDAGDGREAATRALPDEAGSVSGGDAASIVGAAGLARASGTAGDAEAVDRVPLPQLLAAYAQEPLIGRDREIGVLRQATAPREGRRAVLVLGEPGIGKTRHAAAAAADAHTRGELVVLARCPPESVVPFEPWVRAIGELARAGGEAWRRELADAAGPELSVLVPELSGYSVAPRDQEGAGVVVAAEGARYRLLHGIAAVLGLAAAEAPLHLVLDDAHWCDAASAQALGHLLQSAAAARLVLVVTARERELGRGHPVTRVLADMRRTRELSELRLEGLDAGGTAALVAARIGRAITPRLAARLQARTAGNPFFAAELARDLEEQGALRDDRSLQDAPAPNAVTDLVEERLSRLDPDTERLLVAVAAIGPAAPVSLAATATALSAEQADRAVQQALSERLVDEVPAARPTIAFPHALIREALIAGMDDAARARLHLAIATALEDLEDTEPAELARHYGQAVAIAGPAPAIAAYRSAALAAAEGHDPEQAAEQVRSALALSAAEDLEERTQLLLDLGEHELLAGDVYRARSSFLDAAGAARSGGDAGALARAALGFAGGDISFGMETNSYDEQAVELLREGLQALGDGDPRLALRICFRMSFALIYSVDEIALAALAARARELGGLLNDPESQLLARSTEVVAIVGRTSEPLNVLPRIVERFLEVGALAERCDRDDLRFRIAQWSTFGYYSLGEIERCERAIEQVVEIAERLGSPRFTWEIAYLRAQRLLDHGDREGAELLMARAGSGPHGLRADVQLNAELFLRLAAGWLHDGETATNRAVFEAVEALGPWGLISSLATLAAARDGDHETARRRLRALLADDLEGLRRPDAHMPNALCTLALAATFVGDREAGARLRPLLEPLRPYLVGVSATVFLGQLPGWHIGRLELLAGDPEAAVDELRPAVAKADALGLVWHSGAARVDLAIALHRRARPGDRAEARAVLEQAESIAERHRVGWVADDAARARAELDDRAPAPTAVAAERQRPIRGLTARTGRRALSAMVRGMDDEALERRFAEPRRQRALLRAMARGFQPAQAAGFRGVIAYELEPFAIEPPPDAPWRWAIEVDAPAGRARLYEPAPLDAAVTIHLGLADWVRVIAGVENAVTALAGGRCSVEGDLILAVRLEAMFGAG